MKPEREPEKTVSAAEGNEAGAVLSRREFLLLSAGAAASLAAMSISRVWGGDATAIIVDNARGLLLADPSRCVGCMRCELACTEFNDGRAQPSLARIQVSRNINFGPEGPSAGARMQGAWGTGQFIPDTCRQCPHPVPCATACSQGAIQADPETGARLVDPSSCVGCGMCRRACPWNMIVLDEQAQKATKCFLCGGRPKCVEACPAGALRYVPWRDTTREGVPRGAALPLASDSKICRDCHAQ